MIAKDLMTRDPRTVRVDDTIADAIDAVAAVDVRTLPVVDERGRLAGVLSERDLLAIRADRAGEGLNPAKTAPVARFVSGEPICVRDRDDLRVVVDQMLSHRVGAIPVVDDDERVVGIVGFADVLRAVRDDLGGERPTRDRASAAHA